MKDSATFEGAVAALQKHFGYTSFRRGQDEIVTSILEGNDTVAVMPTGGGKSICYQIPALLFDGLTVVVSPLISLMQDQVQALERARIRATFINSMLDYREVNERLDKVRNGWYTLLYVAPERFESQMFVDRMRNTRISLFAIDEAHCISEWGHDFRPSYLRLGDVVAQLGRPQVAALTATATPDVRRDIQVQLGLRSPKLIVRGFNRENLTFRVMTGVNKNDEIYRICSSGDCGIVYAGTRKAVEEIAAMLRRHAIPAEAYHARLDDVRRRQVQERFMRGDIRVIVATTAFGMGIDKGDVRFVIHHDMPGTIEQYYQEAGRAGRDGQQSTCTILHHPKDRSLPEFFIRSSYPDKALVQKVYAQLHHHAGNQLGQTFHGLVTLTASSLAAMLGSTSESAVRGALDLLEASGHIRRIREATAEATVHFQLSANRLREWMIDAAPAQLQPVAAALLRTAGGGAFHHPVHVYTDEIAEKTFLPEEDLLRGMRALHREGIIAYREGRRGSGIALLGPRVPATDLPIDYAMVERRMAHQYEKLQAMEQYITSQRCRRNSILEYFQESDVDGSCGVCDVCTSTVIDSSDDTGNDVHERHAKDVLFCAAETGGRFGRVILVDILRGARTKRIAQYHLQRARMYGRARQVEKPLLLDEVDRLIGMGWLAKTDSLHPSVYLTETGRAQLGEDVAALTLPQPGSTEEAPKDPVLYEALRAVRRRLAAEYNVPSHSLLPDRVLRALCNDRPTTRDACLAVEGMGPVSFDKCGKELLHAIRSHVEQTTLADSISRSRSAVQTLSQTVRPTFELAVQGHGIDRIAELRKLSVGTVSNHLSEILRSGVTLDVDLFVPPRHQDQIRSAAQRLRGADLKKIKALIDDDITYAEIRVMLAVLDREKREARS